MLSGTIMPNESFLFASLRICSCHPRPCGWHEWKLWRLEPGVITQQKTLFIHMSRLSFLFLRSLPFQPHLKTVSSGLCFGPSFFGFSGFRNFHICTRSFLSSFTLAHPSGHSFPVSSSEELSLTYHSRWFCALFSLRCSVLFSPESVVVYIILLLFTTSPQGLLQIWHTVGMQ